MTLDVVGRMSRAKRSGNYDMNPSRLRRTLKQGGQVVLQRSGSDRRMGRTWPDHELTLQDAARQSVQMASVRTRTYPPVRAVGFALCVELAFDAVKKEGLIRKRSYLRQCKYSNNIAEQDHRFIKRRSLPMLGLKTFATAWRTLRGIEMMNALRKGQARWTAKGDVVGQTCLIHQVFGVAI